MNKKGMTAQANKNRDMIADIRGRLLMGVITRDQAKAEAAPLLEAMNARAKEIAKEYSVRFKPFSFTSLMR